MNSRLVRKCSAVLILLVVAGCGLFRFEQRAPWRDQAERECLSAGAVKINSYIEPAREVDGPGSCGMLKPFRISALAEGSVGLKSRALLACPMVSVLDQWLIGVVQPAARLYLGTELAEVNLGSYSCRNVNNQWSGNKSEHSYGNAVDVMSFKFEDGRTLTVPDDQDLTIRDDFGGQVPKLEDGPWPQFPADLTSIAVAVATQAKGTILIYEKMFENRLVFTDKLVSMGARIVLCDPHRAIVTGPAQLVGERVDSPDIRAGMAMLIAALAAEGTTTIGNVGQIDRGYERIDERLRGLGARIERISG